MIVLYLTGQRDKPDRQTGVQKIRMKTRVHFAWSPMECCSFLFIFIVAGGYVRTASAYTETKDFSSVGHVTGPSATAFDGDSWGDGGLQRTSRATKDNEVNENALYCPPCEQIQCAQRRRVRRCKGGLTLDICNCCPVCAKLKGEPCGGESNYLGKCDRGLHCELQTPELFEYHRDGTRKVYTIKKGICKETSSEMLTSDEGHASYCRPKCTPHYCRKNPRAICSAADNAEKQQDCQGTCQHTSCRACHFVPEEQGCVKCSQDDFPCLRRFGKCMKRNFCQKKQFPCKLTAKEDQERGKFQCKVSECLKS